MPARPTAATIPALGIALGLALDALRRAAHQARFPFDLNFWSEDYFMTAMLRLDAGAPTYGPIAEAGSSIYSPGGPWLHYALLAPLGLATSVAANRMLSQLGVLTAIALGTWFALVIAKPAERAMRIATAALAAAALTLAAYANPVAVSLHPVTWEMPVLAAAMLVLAKWDDLSPRSRMIACVLLPALGFLAKQTAGPTVALALAVVMLGDRKSLAIVPIVSLVGAALALHIGTAGAFTDWGLSLLAAQGFEGGSKWHDDFLGMGVWFSPALLGALLYIHKHDRAWLRAALVPLIYAPACLLAFAKTLGGPNNVAALGFVVSISAVGAWLVLLRERASATALLLAHLVLLHPRRHVPTDFDHANAERICAYARARSACGEKVLLGRGTSCTAPGVPRDRMVAIHDAFAAGRASNLSVWDRIGRSEYDLVLIHHTDLHRFGKLLWPKLSAKYRAFYTSPQADPDDFWKRAWQGYASQRMLFFERADQAGQHAVTPEGSRCKF